MECLLLGEHFIFQMAPLSIPGQKRFLAKARKSTRGHCCTRFVDISPTSRPLPPGFSGRTRDWIFNRIPDFVLPIYAHSAVWSWIMKRNSTYIILWNSWKIWEKDDPTPFASMTSNKIYFLFWTISSSSKFMDYSSFLHSSFRILLLTSFNDVHHFTSAFKFPSLSDLNTIPFQTSIC